MGADRVSEHSTTLTPAQQRILELLEMTFGRAPDVTITRGAKMAREISVEHFDRAAMVEVIASLGVLLVEFARQLTRLGGATEADTRVAVAAFFSGLLLNANKTETRNAQHH